MYVIFKTNNLPKNVPKPRQIKGNFRRNKKLTDWFPDWARKLVSQSSNLI